MVECPEYDIVIPARYESSRLPGKLLEDICGQSMIQRVIEQALASSATRVIVAVDDDRIGEHVVKVSAATVVSTSTEHTSGTDRIAEAVRRLKMPAERMIVNVQGDEPLIRADLIDQVAMALKFDPLAAMGTAAVPMNLRAYGGDPNRVKCVIDQDSRALYFSRSVIPSMTAVQSEQLESGLHHIGIYAYTVNYLVEQHAKRPPCALEKSEGLEQLRALYHGDKIAVYIAHNYHGIGVDTPEDLQRVRMRIARLINTNE